MCTQPAHAQHQETRQLDQVLGFQQALRDGIRFTPIGSCKLAQHEHGTGGCGCWNGCMDWLYILGVCCGFLTCWQSLRTQHLLRTALHTVLQSLQLPEAVHTIVSDPQPANRIQPMHIPPAIPQARNDHILQATAGTTAAA